MAAKTARLVQSKSKSFFPNLFYCTSCYFNMHIISLSISLHPHSIIHRLASSGRRLRETTYHVLSLLLTPNVATWNIKWYIPGRSRGVIKGISCVSNTIMWKEADCQKWEYLSTPRIERGAFLCSGSCRWATGSCHALSTAGYMGQHTETATGSSLSIWK